MLAFPHFLGHAEETGKGIGAGYTVNHSLPPGTDFDTWRGCLKTALARISGYAPDTLIVSLGVDTFETDPISFLKLQSGDFTTYEAEIAALDLTTLFVMEGAMTLLRSGGGTRSTCCRALMFRADTCGSVLDLPAGGTFM